jgi:hypothetical protein
MRCCVACVTRNALGSSQHTCCVVVGLGMGSDPAEFLAHEVRYYLQEWVHRGGLLVLHGEQAAVTVLREWFGKSYQWVSEQPQPQPPAAYARQDSCAAALVPVATREALPAELAVASNALANVPAEETLFGSQPCAVAVSAYGKGRLCFVGALEPVTVDLIVCISRP